MDNPESSNNHAGIAKMPTGIEGLDEITYGGLPRNRTTLLVGGPGTGKTVLALQVLVNGARRWGEPGIFVAFEENANQIFSNAASFGWDLRELQRKSLFFLDARMSLDAVPSGQFDLAGMLASLQAKAAAMGARRIVFDSIDVLLAMLDSPMLERREVYRVHEWLAHSGLSGILTARSGFASAPQPAPYGFMQFMADCGIELTHTMEGWTTLRLMQVIKYRGSKVAEGEFPFVIGPRGIDMTLLADPSAYPANDGRVSTGIDRLDTMLNGGYYRGSSVLVSGAPGTAKSTMCGAFVDAACRRGEHALYVSFDEAPGEVVRNMASVNIQLQPHLDAGLLRIESLRAQWGSIEEHLAHITALVDEQQASCLAVDPLSAMQHTGGSPMATGAAQRLLGMAKSRGITLLCTSLLAQSDPSVEATALQVSTIADTWIHLSYVVNAGERNRALTIVKSRGTGHSNQVRELILSDGGISLADVYVAGGEVLMGTLRWERERAQQIERQLQQAETEREIREVQLAEAEAQVRMEMLQREIESLRARASLLNVEQEAQEARWTQQRVGLRSRRSADQQSGTEPDEGPPAGKPEIEEV